MKSKFHQFLVLVTQDEDGVYIAKVPSLPGCHTQAKTLSVLYERMKEAIELYLEVEKMHKKDLPEEQFVGLHQLEVAV